MARPKLRQLALAFSAALLMALPGQAAASPPGGGDALPDVVDAPLLFEGPLPATDPVELDWFSDAVFIGDSRTEGLLIYSALKAGLGLTHPGLNVRTAQTGAPFLVEGKAATLEQALSGGDWGKIYLMLGVNEASWMDEEAYAQDYAALIGRLQALLPQAQIYLQTLIPITAQRAGTVGPDNALLHRRNQLLAQLAQEERVYLVDVASAFAGDDGALPDALSTDGLHFTKEGHHRWIHCLTTHTVGL